MSYGKYGMKKIYGQPDFNNIGSVAYNDPEFALGMLLAQGWNKQYDDRGVRKAQEAMQESLSGEASAEDRNKALDDYIANGGGSAFDIGAANKVLAQYEAGLAPAGSLGMSAGQSAAQNKVSVVGNDVNLDDLYKNMPSGKVMTGADQEKIKELADMYGQISRPASAPNFSAEEWAAAERQKQRALGRPDHQIDAALEAMLPQAQAEETAGKQAYADQLMRILSSYNPEKGYDPNAINQLVELGRHDPTAAALWAKNIPTGGDEYRNKNVVEGQKRQFDYGQLAADNQLGRAKELGRFNSDLKSAEAQKAKQQMLAELQSAFPNASPDELLRYVLGSRKSSLQTGATSQQVNAAKVAIEDEQKFHDNFENSGKPYPYQEQADAARKFLAGVYGGGNSDSLIGDNSELAAMQGFIDKYNGLRKEDLSNVNATLANDKELKSYLMSNPQMIAAFEAQTGIQLPRKK